MPEAVAWVHENLSEHSRSVYYVHPSTLGIDVPEDELIPLYEGWEDRLKAYEDTLEPGWVPIIISDGEYDKYYVGVPTEPEEPKEKVTILADNIRDAINSV